MEDLRFPIGEFTMRDEYSEDETEHHIHVFQTFPQQLIQYVRSLTDEQLNTPYRPGSWTIRELVHHCADSHLNCILRFKWALTENKPTIKTYDQDEFSTLKDYELPIEPSLHILEGLHARLSHILKEANLAQFKRTFYHPELKREISVSQNIAHYAWHCSHHLAHIKFCIEKNGWIN